MPMKMMRCLSCSQDKWHNSGKKEGDKVLWRCTYCGAPVSNSPEGKKAHNNGIRERQVRKVGKLT